MKPVASKMPELSGQIAAPTPSLGQISMKEAVDKMAKRSSISASLMSDEMSDDLKKLADSKKKEKSTDLLVEKNQSDNGDID